MDSSSSRRRPIQAADLTHRRVFLPQVRVAWFSFATVCDRALGAGDYLAIAEAFPTVFLDDVPNLTLQERDQVRAGRAAG